MTKTNLPKSLPSSGYPDIFMYGVIYCPNEFYLWNWLASNGMLINDNDNSPFGDIA